MLFRAPSTGNGCCFRRLSCKSILRNIDKPRTGGRTNGQTNGQTNRDTQTQTQAQTQTNADRHRHRHKSIYLLSWARCPSKRGHEHVCLISLACGKLLTSRFLLHQIFCSSTPSKSALPPSHFRSSGLAKQEVSELLPLKMVQTQKVAELLKGGRYNATRGVSG